MKISNYLDDSNISHKSNTSNIHSNTIKDE